MDEQNMYIVEKKLDLIETQTEYDFIKNKNATSKRLYFAILTTIIGAVIAIVNVFTACVCNKDINRCVLLAFNIMNIIYIVMSCMLQITVMIEYSNIGKKRAENRPESSKSSDNIDSQIIYYKSESDKERRSVKLNCIFGLVFLAMIMISNGILLWFVFN
ncbi:MAG: hypothetical protein HDT28_06995 [Clostridiales bacterium]|nr:hypothetical protein [Clostridiales bacterium]